MTTGLDLSEELGIVLKKFTGDSGDLFIAVENFFAVCKAALAADAVIEGVDPALTGLPGCAYMAEGPPAWDSCPCLIVWSGAPSVGDTFPLQPSLAPMHRIQLDRQVNIVAMTAIVLRCQPTLDAQGNIPQPEAHALITQQVNMDMWALWNWLREAKKQEVLFGDQFHEFDLQPGIAYNPAGAAAGCAITVRTQLDGYRPDISVLLS